MMLPLLRRITVRLAWSIPVALLTPAVFIGACGQRSTALPSTAPSVDSATQAERATSAVDSAATTSQALGSPPPAVALATERAAAEQPTPLFVFGKAGSDPGELMLPVDVGVDDEGSIYVSDSKGVQRFAADGTFLNLIGESVLATAAGIAVSGDGKVYVTGMGSLVHVFDRQGELLSTIGEEGRAPGQLLRPVDAALDSAGNVYVVEATQRRIEKYAPTGEHLQTIEPQVDGRPLLESPRVLTIDQQGRLYVGMGDDYLIQQLSPEGLRLGTFGKSYAGESMWRTGGLALDQHGRLFASRTVGHAIQAFAVGDKPSWLWDYGQLGIELGEFNAPTGLACAGDVLYVADTGNNRIQALRLP